MAWLRGARNSETPATDAANTRPAEAPPDLSGEFPEPVLVNFDPIKAAPYRIVKPVKFAKKFGEVNRQEILKNFDLAKQLAMSELEQELSGMERFVPAAAALKRQQISLDNIFNQMERTQQVDETLPGVRSSLEAQTGRAEQYARGQLPDELQDRALELGVRSRAADAASAGGFGIRSSVARKTSDLMSAEQRVNLAQMGEQLLSGSINQRAGLLLSPTEYSSAGSEVRVMPEVGAGRLTAQALSETNAATLIPPATALQAKIQQKQFKTSLIQRTREFNATGMFAESQANAGIQNQFAMGKFGYQVAQAGVEAGVETANNNTELGIAQQQDYMSIMSGYLAQAQSSQQAGSIASGITSAITAGAGLVGSVADLFGGGGGQQVSTNGGQMTPAQSSEPVSLLPSYGTDSAPPAASSFPSVESVPSGYTPVMSNADGSVSAVPDAYYRSAAVPFESETGISILGSKGQVSPTTTALVKGSDVALQTAGIYRNPGINTQPIGSDYTGQRMYGKRALINSTDGSAGGGLIGGIKQLLDPTGAFTDEDRSTLDQISAAAGDTAFISSLTAQWQAGDKQGFMNNVLNRFGQPTINMLSKDPQNRAGMQAALNGFNMFANWDRMSPAQKSLAVAATGMQASKFGGYDLASKPILKPTFAADGKTMATPGLNVGQALQLFQAGYNVYSMVDHWDQLNDLQKLAGGTATVSQLAQLGKQFNLLGAGTSGAEVAGVTLQNMAAAGFAPAPSLGVGAMTGGISSSVPAGYTQVAQFGNEIVIAPVGSSESAAGAVSSQAGSVLGTAAGVAGVALGAYQVYQGWGQGDNKERGALNGALGGASMAAGLYMLGATNPYLLGGVVAVSALSGLIKTGKHKDQVARDGVRSDWKERGFADQDYNVTLADGTKFNVGQDGSDGRHYLTNPELAGDNPWLKERGDNPHLNAYDVDYTNPLDYTAAMGTSALSRILYGGKETNTEQMSGQLANAALGNVGYNQEFNEGNFNKVMTNLRGFYSQAGIKSKADAYQLANQAFAEKRINDSDLVAAHQAFDMIFDEAQFQGAQTLLAGQYRGIEVALQKPDQEGMQEVAVGAPGKKPDLSNVQPMPRPTVGGPQPIPPADASNIGAAIGSLPTGKQPDWGTLPASAQEGMRPLPLPGGQGNMLPNLENIGGDSSTWGQTAGGMYPKQVGRGSSLMLSREEIAAQNRSRYASEARA